jgi:thiopeptide-type bacteriocin biosynthesis protein
MKEDGFADFGKIMIRNPAYSYQILFGETGNTKDLNELIEIYIKENKFLEAIYWSSTSLYDQVINFNNQKLSERKSSKILLTLKKYLIRASTRPTPYGTFAGTAIQNLDENKFSNNHISKKKIRLDVTIVRKIVKSLEKNKYIFPSIGFKVNNSLYKYKNELRYLEVNKSGENSSQISSFNKNDVLNFICSKKKSEKITFDHLSTELSEFFEKEELMNFFQELVNSGFLVSELELSQTETDELKHIRNFIGEEKFKDCEDISKYKILLTTIQNYIVLLENSIFGEFYISNYVNIKNLLKNLDIIINDDQIFHVDVTNKNIDNFYNFRKNNLYEAVSILSKLTSKKNSQSQITKFKRLFSEKYKTASVSLMEALDPEIGIGFPANENIGHFSHNEIFNFNENANSPEIGIVNNLHSWLIDKIENLNPGEKEIKIWQNELQEFPSKIYSLPNTFNIVGQLVNQDRILLESVGGMHANTLLSRFAYLDNEIESLCNSITEFEKETSKDVIFAELVWIPYGKAGNVTRKITSKNYEIPIYYQSSFPVQNQIYLEDILILVEGDEIILKSKELKKRIIPRLSSAHNYLFSNNPVYKFLCSLQDQKSVDLFLNPNFGQNKKRFFPRIIYKNIILHPCCWILHESDIKSITNSEIPVDELQKFLDKWRVASYVMLAQGDNELFLDISNNTYLIILLDEISKNLKTIVLKEWLYPVKTNDNRFVNQFILPVKKLEPISYKKLTQNFQIIQKKSFYPGGEWVYFKIYCDANYSDIILKKINNQILKKLEKNELINQWFFVRFLDPHYHLRLRIKLNSTESIGEIISQLNLIVSSYIKKNIVFNTKIDTYEPEIDRYLQTTIESAEYVFFRDSSLFLKLAKKNEFQQDINIRLFSAIKNVDFWLDLFCLNIKEKRDFCEKMKCSLTKEQSKNLISQTENLYRNKILTLDAFLKSDKFANLFEERDKNLRNVNLNISNLEDFIHMSINRWFKSNQRNWEYTIYYFCQRNYNKKLYCSSNREEISEKV